MAYPIFSGKGAKLVGGRWNSIDKEVIYASTSLALARLEKLVQLDSFDVVPKGLGQIEIKVPVDIIPTVGSLDLYPISLSD
jgi:RES domain-containing protein